ncbi:MAG: lipocalin family protein [Bdellovibrionaceae bacterium]|nr:lipocalin family protein [Pseudobdellovibrionaceae bacterium]
MLPDGLLKVVNTCDQSYKKITSPEARARLNKEIGSSSTLEVTFVKIFKWIWSFAGDYWIVYINDDYNVAIVGHTEYKYGWILSKSMTLTIEEYIKINNVLKQQGYESCRFIMSITPEQNFVTQLNLCDLVSSHYEEI